MMGSWEQGGQLRAAEDSSPLVSNTTLPNRLAKPLNVSRTRRAFSNPPFPLPAHAPSFPPPSRGMQVYINGEFIGGADILMTMHTNGELKSMLTAGQA